MTSLQQEIITKLGAKPEIDPKEEIRTSVDFMKEYLKKHSFLKTLILGISGGQDSTLLGKMAQMAIDEMREETGDEDYQFIGVRLPYGKQADEEDVNDVMEWIQPNQDVNINIKDSVDSVVSEMEANGLEVSDFNKGNIKARQRMIVQYAIAGDYKGVVLGSDHAAESV